MAMDIYNKTNSKHNRDLRLLGSWMLISPRNTKAKKLSVQIAEIPVDSEQPMHSHDPEQCYYVIRGKGLMVVENESNDVQEGDAVYIATNLKHGIKNTGHTVLEYLTVNAPVFSEHYEDAHWPEEPSI